MMDNTAAEILGLVLGLSGIGLLILANATDCWRHDAKDQFSSVGLSARCRGLWSECLFDNMANIWTCDIPLSYLGDLPVDMVVTRALVIVTCGVCVVGIVGLVCGMKCTTLVCDADSQKDKLTVSSGALFLFAGVCGAVGLFWYGIDTLLKYRQEVAFGIPGVTYELGYSYWFASGGVACQLATGLIILTVNCFRQRKAAQRRTPRPPALQSTPPRPDEGAANSKTYI